MNIRLPRKISTSSSSNWRRGVIAFRKVSRIGRLECRRLSAIAEAIGERRNEKGERKWKEPVERQYYLYPCPQPVLAARSFGTFDQQKIGDRRGPGSVRGGNLSCAVTQWSGLRHLPPLPLSLSLTLSLSLSREYQREYTRSDAQKIVGSYVFGVKVGLWPVLLLFFSPLRWLLRPLLSLSSHLSRSTPSFSSTLSLGSFADGCGRILGQFGQIRLDRSASCPPLSRSRETSEEERIDVTLSVGIREMDARVHRLGDLHPSADRERERERELRFVSTFLDISPLENQRWNIPLSLSWREIRRRGRRRE